MKRIEDPYAGNTPKQNQLFVLKISGILILFISVVLGTDTNYFVAVGLTIFLWIVISAVATQFKNKIQSS